MVLISLSCQMMRRQAWSQQLWQGEMVSTFLSAVWCGEVFYVLGVQDAVKFDSGWCCISAWWRKEMRKRQKKKKKKEKRSEKSPWGRRVFPGLDPPCWLCHVSQVLGPIKVWFEGQSLNFFSAPNVVAVIILARSSQNYPSVSPMSQGGFWRHGV
jgi:hypothetical protein